jgi:hypothetical protein
MAKKILIITGAVVLLVLIGLAAIARFYMRGPDLSKYQYLINPQISQKPDQRMLQVEASGDPNTVGMKAFAILFKAYYQNVKAKGMVAPRARWPKPFDTPKDQWVGQYGLPVPETLVKLENVPQQPGYAVSLIVWQYGEVAEILHAGPYSTEGATMEKLKSFIAAKGYQFSGPHEEEYLRGPGMFGRGDPSKYCTIIRYQVEPIPADTLQTKGRSKPSK